MTFDRFESVRKIAGEDDALNEDEMQCIERLFKVSRDVYLLHTVCDV